MGGWGDWGQEVEGAGETPIPRRGCLEAMDEGLMPRSRAPPHPRPRIEVPWTLEGPGLVEGGGAAPSGYKAQIDIPETVFESLYKVWEI